MIRASWYPTNSGLSEPDTGTAPEIKGCVVRCCAPAMECPFGGCFLGFKVNDVTELWATLVTI